MTTDYINMLNAGSGLNTKEIIDSLVEAERVPVETLITKKTDEIEVSISSFGTLKQNFSDLETNMSGLDGITGMSISQSGTSVDAEVTDNTLFSEFSSDFEVSQIATEHTMVFDGFASELASVGSGTITFEFGTWSNGTFSVNSDATGGNVTISSGADTLAEVKASINAAGLGVTASILKQSDSNYALVLKSQEGEESAMRISMGTSKTVSQTTTGVLNTTAEVQSVAGFASSDLSSLNGKTLFLHDGTNSLSVDFSSTPSNLAAVVTAITSATGYGDMDFAVVAGTDALTLTYNSSDGNVELAQVSILPSSSLAVTQTTKGVASSTAEVQSVAGFTATDISSLNGKTLFLHDGTNSLNVSFSSTPANLAAVVTAITSATGYSDLNFAVSAGTNALTLTYNSSDGDVELADVGYLSATETVTAVDANLTIDGVPITRTSNIISDLIDGMTLTLNSTTSSAETVSGSFDSDSAYLAFSLFIDEINTIKTSLDKLTDRGGLTTDAGPLAGDPLAGYFKNQLGSILNASIPGFDEEEIYLAYFGFETQQDGSFVVNQDTFTDYFETNPAHFSAFFNSRVSADSALISASMIGDNYTAGVYSFVIDDNGNGSVGDTNLTNTGNIYSSLSGDVSGLFIETQTGADDTTLYVGRSLLDTLSSFTSQILSTSGDIADKVSDLNTSLLDYQDDVVALDERMVSLKERYNEQFGAMEAAIANMKSTETTITNMMEAWKGSMKN
mgnify:CR=1 FL=1